MPVKHTVINAPTDLTITSFLELDGANVRHHVPKDLLVDDVVHQLLDLQLEDPHLMETPKCCGFK